MAVDTAAKRYSMMSLGDGGTLVLLPAPDGTIALADMQHLLDCYGGIAFAGVSSVAITSQDRTGPRYWVRRIQ